MASQVVRETSVGALCLALACLGGCNAKTVRVEHAGARQALLSLAEEQIFDNLIRAAPYRPIVHMDYADVTSTVTGEAKITVDGSREEADNNFVAAGAGDVARAVTYTLTPTAEASQNKALSVKGAPATGTYVNNAYVNYLNQFINNPAGAASAATEAAVEPAAPAPKQEETLEVRPPQGARGEGQAEAATDAPAPETPAVLADPPQGKIRRHLRASADRPDDDEVHHNLVRRVGDKWYWVPKTSAPRFFVLFQETTFVRKPTPAAGATDLETQLELLRMNTVGD